MLADDHHGLNSGVLFIRVEERSLQWVNSVLMHPRTGKKHLDMHEQSIMEYTVQDLKFEERGQVLFVPQTWFNSYSGHNAVERLRNHASATSSVQLHFPSPSFKTRAMLPLLKSFRKTPQLVAQEDLIKASERFTAQTAAWWAAQNIVGSARNHLAAIVDLSQYKISLLSRRGDECIRLIQ